MSLAETKTRRPRRIAADEAHSWARNLRLGNPYAKLVLSMLTIYVNGEGSCFVSINALAEDCELAFETVRKRLAWLESVGAITRFPQWIDEHGRRNSEGRGRRTTDDIRLMINSDPDEIEAKAHGNGDDGNTSTPRVTPSPEGGANSAELDADPLVAPPVAPASEGGTYEPESEPEDSPPDPPPGGDAGQSDDCEGTTWRGCDTWPDFERAWQEPILRQSMARQRWSALTEEECRLAIRAAAGYVVWRHRQKKPPNVINAHTFLKERDAWAKFAELAPPEPPVVEKMTILPGSPAWLGFCVVKQIWGRPAPEGAVEVQAAALPYLKSLAALRPNEKTPIIEIENRAQAQAWRERLAKCGFQMPPPQRIDTDEEHERLGRVHKIGWMLPSEWPPRMDGTLSATGPPT